MENITKTTKTDTEIRVSSYADNRGSKFFIWDNEQRFRSNSTTEVIEYVQANSQCGDAFIESMILSMDDGYINSVTFCKFVF